MSDKLMQVLAEETGGKSYKAHKYGLDHADRPFIDYGDNSIIWQRTSETIHHRTYVSLESRSAEVARRGEQHLFGIPSLRQTHQRIQDTLSYRWFLGYGLLDEIPHFATVS